MMRPDINNTLSIGLFKFKCGTLLPLSSNTNTCRLILRATISDVLFLARYFKILSTL
jgi:hypothetical protein